MNNPHTSFPGVIGTTAAESTPWWETPPAAGCPRPNVVMVILDDTGWSDFGCFGSEISTPVIDSLAAEGVRYSNFHVTPLCSPTRASLLTGRNHHSVGMRFLADTDTGFPNSRGAIRADVPMLPGILRSEGYGTYLVGKWHLAPLHEVTPAGPFRNWPLARGFDRYYGFMDGCTDQYEPELYEDNHQVPIPDTPGYHLSEDLVDKAGAYLRDHVAFRSGDPFYLQLAMGATHAPFQAPREFIDKYLDTFTKGWDATRRERLERQIELGVSPVGTVLTERVEGVAAWDELDDDQRTVFSALQAAFAGFLEHTDTQLGRLLGTLRELGAYENTIVMVMSDNGASPEGGPGGDVDTNAPYSGVRRTAAELIPLLGDLGTLTGGAHYPTGWAMAGNTPFRRYKQFVDLGGVRSPLVVSWPAGNVAAGSVSRDFIHAIDVAPTLLELAGITAPEPMDGASAAGTLHAEGTGRPTQYWEMMGHRALWHEGWRAVTRHLPGEPYASDEWRLYDTAADFAEATDLSAEHPERLAAMRDLWWEAARENAIFPLDDRPLHEAIGVRGPVGLYADRQIVLRPGQGHVPLSSSVTGSNRDIDLTAHLGADSSRVTGVLLHSGNAQGGYLLRLEAGHLVFEHSMLRDHLVLVAPSPLEATARRAGFRLRAHPDGSGEVELVDGVLVVASARLARTSAHLSFWGLDVAHVPVSTFSAAELGNLEAGLLEKIVIDVHPAADDNREYADAILASE
ncbi:arylsulfatase [Paeniglutamicibacter cryotolerans]|uniref:Arylsulfatase n=1 Tax=Paeniglutamicibacter cryotolerans TaxID=670079 RepID=A0A839QQP9_9MICC|nr:arylsulfatase [Paeniglutamicibacter cryotolerans]MBB2996975.1 arylsulfatase [Paeniglutamicibacter cryotolerans]